MLVEVAVVPKSGRFSLSLDRGRLRVFLKSAPEGNKANLELLKEMRKATGAAVRLAAGAKSRRKTLDITISEEAWGRFLDSLKS